MQANHHLKPNVRDNRTAAFGARGRALLPLQVQDDRCVFASDGAVVIVIVVVVLVAVFVAVVVAVAAAAAAAVCLWFQRQQTGSFEHL